MKAAHVFWNVLTDMFWNVLTCFWNVLTECVLYTEGWVQLFRLTGFPAGPSAGLRYCFSDDVASDGVTHAVAERTHILATLSLPCLRDAVPGLRAWLLL